MYYEKFQILAVGFKNEYIAFTLRFSEELDCLKKASKLAKEVGDVENETKVLSSLAFATKQAG